MSADCYLCAMGYGVIPQTRAGDAVGACKLCGVLACLGHALRNSNGPAYECGVCVVNLLATAATRKGGPGGAAPRAPDDDDIAPGGGGGYARAARIDDLDDILPGYPSGPWSALQDGIEYLTRALARTDGPADAVDLARLGDDRARTLMAAAIAIATELRLPPHELVAPLRPLVLAFQYDRA